MKVSYQDLNIKFNIGHTSFSVLNIVFEDFRHSIPKHSHSRSSYEIHYVPKGKGTLVMNHMTYNIAPGTLFITGPQVEHEQIPNQEDPMSEYCIYLRSEKIARTDNGSGDDSPGDVFVGTPAWFGKDNQDLNSLMQMIFYELEQEGFGFITQVSALLEQCIIKITRNYQQKKAAEGSFRTTDLAESKYLLAEEYFLYDYRRLVLGELAKKLRLSCRQTERFLKECYGKTFTQKKAEAKMSAAVLLLADPQQSISSIAEMLGYSSLEHFSTAFRRYYGMTASKYRKLHNSVVD